MARTIEGCKRSRIISAIKECFNLQNENNAVISSLIDELYWQIIKMEECRNLIDNGGIATKFKQGKQDMTIQNPVLKTYNDLIKNQSITIKSLQVITGKSDGKDKDVKELMDFLNKGKKQTRTK